MPMHSRFILIALAVVGVLALGAIVIVNMVSARSTPPAALTQPTWTLTTLVVDGQVQALAASRPATLHFDTHDGQVSGTGGCNSFGGSYSLNGNQVQFGELRSTLIGCLDPVVSGQESHYFQALSGALTYNIQGATLTLSGNSGRVQLTFRAS
jgi:heat shock protein HslJ